MAGEFPEAVLLDQVKLAGGQVTAGRGSDPIAWRQLPKRFQDRARRNRVQRA